MGIFLAKWLKMLRFFKTAIVLGAFTLAWTGLAAPKSSSKAIDFNRDIRPILSDNCFKCHGPDEKERKAKLRLDRQEDAFKAAKSGDFAIVPGDIKKSKLIERITATDEEKIAMLQLVKAKSFEKKDLLTADEFRAIVDRVLQKQSV